MDGTLVDRDQPTVGLYGCEVADDQLIEITVVAEDLLGDRADAPASEGGELEVACRDAQSLFVKSDRATIDGLSPSGIDPGGLAVVPGISGFGMDRGSGERAYQQQPFDPHHRPARA